MSVSSDEISAHGDEDHGVRDVDALLVIADEAAPACHPSERALEASLIIGPGNDLDDEVEVSGLVHQFRPVIGAVGEEMLHPRPSLADGVQDRLGAGAVGDIGGGEVDPSKTARPYRRRCGACAPRSFYPRHILSFSRRAP